MNPIVIVLPILAVLMFDLGLTLRVADFALAFKRPRAALVALWMFAGAWLAGRRELA